MRAGIWFFLLGFALLATPIACIDPESLDLTGSVDVIVVDGALNTLPQPQLIRLNRSRADRLTGRFGVTPLTQAHVQVLVDSGQVVTCTEGEQGAYQLPNDFQAQVGHYYQLRFTLSDGTRYQSNQQRLAPVPPIDRIRARYNPKSLPPTLFQGFTEGYDVYLDTKDPAGERNFYRWEWILYERQYWCRSCSQSNYMPNQLELVSSAPQPLVYRTLPLPYEDCFPYPSAQLRGGSSATPSFTWDYYCRTACYEIIPGRNATLLADNLVNGQLISAQPVGQVPYYTRNPALVEVRQSSLSADAYQFFSLFEQQTQNTGGLADTPPAALVGNVRNLAKPAERVVGFFSVSAVTTAQYWIDKKDGSPYALGAHDENGNLVAGDAQLFYALNRRQPLPESPTNSETTFSYTIIGGGSRPPTAVCGPLEQRTPVKPAGWRE